VTSDLTALETEALVSLGHADRALEVLGKAIERAEAPSLAASSSPPQTVYRLALLQAEVMIVTESWTWSPPVLQRLERLAESTKATSHRLAAEAVRQSV